MSRGYPYFIYWNLHKNLYSLRYKGIVIEHVDCALLDDCRFRVQPAGRKRVLETQTKNVHAGIAGKNYSRLHQKTIDRSWIKISYNPYKFDYFYNIETQEPVYEAKRVLSIINEGKPNLYALI